MSQEHGFSLVSERGETWPALPFSPICPMCVETQEVAPLATLGGGFSLAFVCDESSMAEVLVPLNGV